MTSAGGGARKAKAERFDAAIGKLLPIVLVLLLAYLYVKLFTDIQHVAVSILEYGLILYFTAELAVKRWLSESWRQFFAEHWLKIVLVLPFFRSFRLIGLAGRSAPGWIRALPYAQKLSKLSILIKKVKPALLVVRAYLSLRERRRAEREAAASPTAGDRAESGEGGPAAAGMAADAEGAREQSATDG